LHMVFGTAVAIGMSNASAAHLAVPLIPPPNSMTSRNSTPHSCVSLSTRSNKYAPFLHLVS
jgi:hypothetical protein